MLQKINNYKNQIALFLAILFHLCGVIGILFTPYKEWFISNTPFTLLLMALLLIFTQQQKNISFFLFFIVAFATGMTAEIIGVHTGKLFGNYSYGNILGIKFFDVPLLIGANWFIIIYCAGCIIHQLNEWIYKKFGDEMQLSPSLKIIAFVLDAAMLTTFFDWLMEPIATRLGYWQWLGDGKIHFFNYLCWFAVSAALLLVFNKLKFNKHNQFAVHLFIIQLLFFLVLSL